MNYRECYERGCSALNDAGIEAKTEEIESDNEYQIVIKFPKR